MDTISLPAHFGVEVAYLRIINLYSPLLLVVCFATTSVYTTWRDQVYPTKPSSRFWGKLAISLNLAIAFCFTAQAIFYLRNATFLPESGFIHDLSQLLIWSTLFLSLVSSSSPPALGVYLPVWSLSLLLEGTIAAINADILQKTRDVYVPRMFLQAITIAVHVLLIVRGLAMIWTRQEQADQEETQPLLAESSRSPQGSVTRRTDSADGESEASDTDDDEVDPDEKRLLAQRKQRLQEGGGWLAYAKSFTIFLPYVFPFKNIRLQCYIAIILLNTVLQRAINLFNPWQLSIVIDHLTETRTIPWTNVALWIISSILSFDSCGLGAITESCEQRLATWSRKEMHLAAFERVMSMSMSFHDEKDSGEVIKALEQAGALNGLFRTLVLDIAPGMLDVVIALWFVGYLFDVYATLILFAVGIIFVFTTKYVTTRLSHARRNMTKTDRDQSKVLFESVSNWSTVAYFNRKRHEVVRLSDFADKNRVADNVYTNESILMWGSQEFCEQMGRLAVSLLALHRIVIGTSTVGKFVALQSYWATITMPLYILGHSYRSLTSDLVDAERLLQIFETPITVKDKELATPMEVNKGEVEFDSVGFGYEGHKPTLDDLNFKALPGQTIALVGETGSGKSTTLKLLMRFYDVTQGSIKIDGQDIRDVTTESLRDVFGFVPQDSVLFNTTILENVRYGRLDATDEEVHKACEEACIHDRILSFPKGYNSLVGERGVKLSGGERQRIAIARVMLKRPKIVLLDEATSSMDSLTETKIQNALERLMKGQTAFVIAHRLSTVANADKILVLDKGKIIESGTHAELLKRGGRYVELWKKQEITSEPPVDEIVKT